MTRISRYYFIYKRISTAWSVVIVEYFINQKWYFYLLILHVGTGFLIEAIALMVASDAMLEIYYKHVCGLFEIAR